jgi:hypothetical protein
VPTQPGGQDLRKAPNWNSPLGLPSVTEMTSAGRSEGRSVERSAHLDVTKRLRINALAAGPTLEPEMEPVLQGHVQRRTRS